MDRVRAALHDVLGDDVEWERVQRAVVRESVAPGTVVRAVGDVTHDVLVVEQGLFEIESPGEPPRWAMAGAMIGLAGALLGAPSTVRITAIRHARLARLPVVALWGDDSGATGTFAIAQLTRLTQLARGDASAGDGLLTVPPDPLVIAAIVEGLDAEREATIAELLQGAATTLERGKVVRVGRVPDEWTGDLADELAAHEDGGGTVLYIIGADAGSRGAAVTAHADRVLLIQPMLTSAEESPARTVACDGSPRRHTEVVYVSAGVQSTAESTRRMRAPSHIRRTHLLPELSAARIELLLTELRRGAREHETLRHFEVFSQLTAPELAWIQRQLRWERVDGGSLLVQQGHAADALWLLRTGRLEVFRASNARQHHLASLGPGSVVGEAAVLAGSAHTESVRALRDSTVARLDRETVMSLMKRSIGFARVMARVVARESTTRSFGESDPGVHRGRTLALVPLIAADRARQFAGTLASAMIAAGSDTTVVDTERLDQALGASASRTRRGDVGDSEIIAWLSRLEEQHETVLLVCGTEVDSWMRRAVRQSDALLFIADAKDSPAVRPVEAALLSDSSGAAAVAVPNEPQGTSGAFVGQRHLVLLQPAGIVEATGTGAWLVGRTAHKHHHVREGSQEDLARIARRLTGRAVALALSGAASRAPAHFGVVRAMQEHGLPIDTMSGSSSGAGVAALMAMGWPHDVALRHALSIIRNGVPTLRQFQPPITALTSGREANEVLQAVFGDRQLEDQLVPVIITAVDIRRHRLVLLTRGPIWKLLRASGSLPLLWPPVWHDDDLLVDGAILSYLPMDVFGGEADAGLTVASNLEVSSNKGGPAFERSLRYGSVLSGWRVISQRVFGTKSRPPRLVEILYHAMAIPSFQQQEALAQLAARENVCVLTPQLGSYGLFGATAEIGKRLEEEAWAHANEVLREVAERWRGAGGAIGVRAQL